MANNNCADMSETFEVEVKLSKVIMKDENGNIIKEEDKDNVIL